MVKRVTRSWSTAPLTDQWRGDSIAGQVGALVALFIFAVFCRFGKAHASCNYSWRGVAKEKQKYRWELGRKAATVPDAAGPRSLRFYVPATSQGRR